MSVPCENCLLIPVCRNKYFIDMKNDCSIIEQYLFCGMVYNRRRKDFDNRIAKIKKIVSPRFWDCGEYDSKNKYFSYKKKASRRTVKYFSYSGSAL
jgi:hypothetical protein